MNKKKFSYWNICHKCALAKGGRIPPGESAITVTTGTCNYCKRPHQTLIPLSDFDWPKEGKKAIFD